MLTTYPVMKKPFLFFILSLFSISFVHAYDFAVKNSDGVMIYYNKTGTNATVTYQVLHNSNYSGNVIIPNEVAYNGVTYAVTSIGNSAFYSCRELTSITIPNSVISIENYAFDSCSGLTSLTIPNFVTFIGKRAFGDCSGLTSLTIGRSVTFIGSHAFINCSGLTNVIIEDGTATLSFEDNSEFSSSPIKNLHLGRNITYPSESPFQGNTTLTTLTIGSSVTSIGNLAFYGCSSLTSPIIPNSVTSIGLYAFNDCRGLTELTIPSSVTSIGELAFSGCSGLTSLTIPNSVTSIGTGTFQGCSRVSSLTIPNSVTSIGDFAFANCSKLMELTIPESVSSIGECAFAGCIGLTSLTIPNSVTDIGKSAFSNCNKLTNVVIEDGTSTLFFDMYDSYSSNIFKDCPIESLYVGRNITYNYSPFRDKITLTSITIGNLVTSIDDYTFASCNMLKEMVVNNPIPVKIFENTFPYNIKTAIVYVPLKAYIVYFKTDIWKDMLLTGKDIDGTLYNLTQVHATEGESIITVNNEEEEIVLSKMGENITVSLKNEGANYIILINGIDYTDDFQNETVAFSPLSINHIYTYQFTPMNKIIVHLENSGTLIDSIGVANLNNVKELIISGDINGADILTIRKMTNLVSLDMTDATIVSGGGFYYQSYTTFDNTIGNYFFKDKTNLAIVKFPNTVTTIESYIFDGCIHLKSVYIPESVTSIGSYAFSDCSSLVSLTIPNSVISIGEYAFRNCSKWTWALVIPNSVTDIRDGTFQNCSRLNGALIIPNSVASIGNSTFSECRGLTSLTIPDSVIGVGDNAFQNCTGLTNITIPNSVSSIGNQTFSGCIELTSLTISNSVTSIGSSTFAGCSKLTSLSIPNSVISIGDAAFARCNRLVSIIIPNTVTTIGEYAFQNCSTLKNIILEDGTATLSFGTKNTSLTFENCPLESLYIGRDIFYDPYYSPFSSKTTLTSITIGNLATSIEGGAFQNCSGLTELTISNSVTFIGGDAFFGCSGLTELTIPNSITNIESGAFQNCNNLKNIVIEDGTTTLLFGTIYPSDNIFKNCPLDCLYMGRSISYSSNSPFCNKTTMKSITIGDLVTTIGGFTFSGCSGLTSLTISDLVSSIGEYAFSGCINLIEINSKNPIPPQAKGNTFQGVDKEKCALYVPVGSFTPYSQHTVWKQFLNMQEKDFSSENAINNIASDAEISAYITNFGIEIIGCNPMDKVSIYTITGQPVYNSIAGTGFISYPFQKGGVYIIHTPRKSLKVIY